MKPLQVPQQDLYKKRGCLHGILHISQKTSSFGFCSKGTLPQGSFNGIPGREMPHHWSPPSVIYQIPQYMSPPPAYQVPLDWEGAPTERDAHIRRLSQHTFQGPQ
jgi:hypothetical protein